MQTVLVTAADFEELLQREEGHFLDFKARETKPNKIQQLAVAFANSDGGEMLIGIKDASDASGKERWHGFDNIESMNDTIQAIFNLNPSVNPDFTFMKREDQPGYILKVRIEKSSSVCKTEDNIVYVRKGAASLKIKEPERIQALTFAKGASSFEDAAIKDVPAEIIVESAELSTLLTDWPVPQDPLDFCLKQNLLEARTWSTRAAGILLFAENPSAFMDRKCAVKIARYETREDDPEREHLIEQRSVEGPAFHIIRNAVQEVTNIMSGVKVWTPDGMSQLQYPPEAVWEIIANAVIHRDYSISDDIKIIIFNDRIEVYSPGKLPGYVTVENILESRFSRNPKIVRILNRYKDAPNKNFGEGLNTAFQKMKEFGLKEPILTEEGNYVKVTLPHSPLANPADLIFRFVKANGKVTNKQARELTGIRSENLVKIEFYKLRDQGLIEMDPKLKGPRSAWRLTKAGEKANIDGVD